MKARHSVLTEKKEHLLLAPHNDRPNYMTDLIILYTLQ